MRALYKPTFFLLFSALWATQAKAQVTQIGGDILPPAGITAADRFGEQIVMSGDGQRLAIAAPLYDSLRGAVAIYEYDGSAWLLLDTLIGSQRGEQFGAQVALSFDGQRLAVGAPNYEGTAGAAAGIARFYASSGSDYSQTYQIEGTQAGGHFAAGLALGSDGKRFVVGAPDYRDTRPAPLAPEGIAYLYECNEDLSACGLERTFIGQNNGVFFGKSVAISPDSANILISGGVDHGFVDSTGRTSGARLFQLDTATNFWNSRQNTYTTMFNENFGYDLAVSNTVTDSLLPTLLIGAPTSNITNQQRGKIYIINYAPANLIQNQLQGNAFGDRFGNSVDISADGQYMVVGSPLDDQLNTNGGEWRIYTPSGNQVAIYHTQGGTVSNAECGTAVSNSDNGLRTAISCTGEGTVRVYQLVPVATRETTAPLDMTLYPNPVNSSLSLQLAAPTTEAAFVLLVDVLGREKARHPISAGTENAELDCSGLPAGLYLLQVQNKEGKALNPALKIMKN